MHSKGSMGLLFSNFVHQCPICHVQNRNIFKLFHLCVVLTSWITMIGAQGIVRNCTSAMDESGIILSPDYPLDYPNSVTCTWHLRSSSDLTNIKLQFLSFTTEEPFDKLYIYDEKGISKMFFGRTLPPVLTLGKVAKLVFTSDASGNYGSFYANFTSFDVASSSQCNGSDVYWCRDSTRCISHAWVCDGQRDCTKGEDEAGCPTTDLKTCETAIAGSGTIQSPNYPLNYPDNIRCTWNLRSQSNTTIIRLQFHSFETESYDRLIIADEKHLQKTFSGPNLPPVMTLGKSAQLIFTTDGSVNQTGFAANFTSFDITIYNECDGSDVYWCNVTNKCVSQAWMCDGQWDCIMGEDEAGCPTTPRPTPEPCGGTLVGSGYIESPNYPVSYPNNARCSWNISSGNNNNSLLIQFTDFDLEQTYDYIDIYDTRNVVKRYTGVGTPSSIIPGNHARVEFFSDSSNSHRGFRAIFDSFDVSNRERCLTNAGFWCESNQKCISISWRCDGYQDCANTEDESLCPSTTDIIQTATLSNGTTKLYDLPASPKSSMSIETVMGIVMGTVCGVILLVLLTVGAVSVRRVRQATARANNYQQTAETPATIALARPTSNDTQVGQPNRQAAATPAAGDLPMDQYKTLSSEATVKADSRGFYENPLVQSGEASSSSQTVETTTSSAL